MFQYNINWKSKYDGRVWYNLLNSHKDLTVAQLESVKVHLEGLVDNTKVGIEKITKALIFDPVSTVERSQIYFSYDWEENGVGYSNNRNMIPFLDTSKTREQWETSLQNAIDILVGSDNEILMQEKVLLV